MKFTTMQNSKYWKEMLIISDGNNTIERIYKEYNFLKQRDRQIETRGFPIITTETFSSLIEIVKGKKVLDVGAGTGYLSYHLQKKGVDVTPIVERKGRYGFKRNFFTKRIIKANCLEYDISNFNAFILSWPCYQSDHAEKFLFRMKSGDMLIYQGELKGDSCATDEFFDRLDNDFALQENETSTLNKNHFRFYGIRDSWEVWIKK